jgi:hypothetical protein
MLRSVVFWVSCAPKIIVVPVFCSHDASTP